MAEARPETPQKRYSCACGLAQDDKRSKFAEPPPYSSLSGGTEGVTTSRRRDARRRSSTPPPPYDVAQKQVNLRQPPSYEEALALNVVGLQISETVALPPIDNDIHSSDRPLPIANTATTDGPSNSIFSSSNCSDSQRTTHSGILQEQATILESQRETRSRRDDQQNRQAQREAEREEDYERELELEHFRELQLAQYCGCAKCQSLYYSYCYDEAINDAGVFPMETQVLMQEVLSDGLAFCSLM